MHYNRIAVYSHRGWASSAIVQALIASGAYTKVLYRPGSDISSLPSTVSTVEIDVADQSAVIDALKDIDIVISLVGHEGVLRQLQLVSAIAKTNVQLFVPSDLAARYDEQGMRIPVNNNKGMVEAAAQAAGIPTTVVLPGNFAEFALATRAMGVDIVNNRIIFTGHSATHPVNLCTRSYVAAAYASIFASTSIDRLKNRTLALAELRPTGNDIAAALSEKFGAASLTTSESIPSINAKIEAALDTGKGFALPYYCRKIWGTGQQANMVGSDVWDDPKLAKASLQELLVEGKLQDYREPPPGVNEFFATWYESCQ
ncbi:NAD(P)-binding protein [Aspergillus uvarum CBS 121591]|uniref:NAD(P)-binding protein n=1 Tax=Aspergillus uvarum CBS 121591 TaxID=1448315 RepID=A0A319BW89_9EURO|nr:NAD(P)-binding protein [Aspergillus uvarum CBS 121591]PYH76965.1 NAD(P)-binding protein [Aspergillus uvarum CBS 121591]